MGDLLHNRPNALIKAWLNQGFTTISIGNFVFRQGRTLPVSSAVMASKERPAGDVRFIKETLEMDHDGDGSADFAVLIYSVDSLKGANLIL